MPERLLEDVLTLGEAASYLRVPEGELLRLAEQQEVPSQRIAGEWRFLKRAIDKWLSYGPRFLLHGRDDAWILDPLLLEELVLAVEKRVLQRLAPARPERGSKQAVGKHLGVLEGEGDLEEVLASLSALRAPKPGEGGG